MTDNLPEEVHELDVEKDGNDAVIHYRGSHGDSQVRLSRSELLTFKAVLDSIENGTFEEPKHSTSLTDDRCVLVASPNSSEVRLLQYQDARGDRIICRPRAEMLEIFQRAIESA